MTQESGQTSEKGFGNWKVSFWYKIKNGSM